MTDPVSLHPVQIEVAHLFFDLPESKGFLLAGAAGLADQGMTTRATEDLDLFTGPGQADVGLAAATFESAAAGRGWTTVRVRDAGEFVRLEVAAGETQTVR